MFTRLGRQRLEYCWEREGISDPPAPLQLILFRNPEEGRIAPQLLDRFDDAETWT